MCAIAIASIKRPVVYKPIKVLVYYISYHDFFGMSVYHFTSFIIWKSFFETSRTISVVSR